MIFELHGLQVFWRVVKNHQNSGSKFKANGPAGAKGIAE
jgi:hypothetical protein